MYLVRMCQHVLSWTTGPVVKLLSMSCCLKQNAARNNSRDAYAKYVESATESSKACTLRGQLEFVPAAEPVHLDEVEPATNIVKRFVTGQLI